MNINLFTGLNAKKSSVALSSDSQIFKISRHDELAYDKFKEIMGNIKKHESAEYCKGIKYSYKDSGATAAKDFGNVEETAEKSMVSENMETDNSEDKSLSIRKLRKIDEKMCEFVSFLVLANSSGGQKIDDFTVWLKEGQIAASGGDEEILLSPSFLESFDANIAANLDLMINSFLTGSISESDSHGNVMTMKDALAGAIFDALNKSIQNQNILDGSLERAQLALEQEFVGSSQATDTGAGGIVLTEVSALESAIQEMQLLAEAEAGQTSAGSIIYEDSPDDAQTGANIEKGGRSTSLEQALIRLLKQIGITEELIDKKISSIISGFKAENGEFGLKKKDFLNLMKKITIELSQLSKNSAASLTEQIARLEAGSTVKFGLNSHLAKSLRNSELFEVYSDRFLKPLVFQQSANPGMGISGPVINGPLAGNTTVNLADVIMQISSKIINKDGPVIRQLEIVLKPESLGAIRIKVEAAGDGVSIKIQTQYSHTEEIISSNLDMLKSNLSEKGVLLKDLSVFMDQDTGANGKSFEGFSGFGEALKQESNPGQYREAESFASSSSIKDSNGTGKTGDISVGTLSIEDNNTFGVDIVA